MDRRKFVSSLPLVGAFLLLPKRHESVEILHISPKTMRNCTITKCVFIPDPVNPGDYMQWIKPETVLFRGK